MHRLLLICLLFLVETGSAQEPVTFCINHVNLIDMVSERIQPDQRVVITGSKIVRIEKAASALPADVTVIDGQGKYLIPGLSEMHYHLRSNDIQSDFKLLLANGITTVRNMAALEGQDHIDIRNRVLSGALTGPNYYSTGPYLQARDLGSRQQVHEVVQMHKNKGFDFLKIADNLPKDIYLELLAESQLNRLPVVGHAQRALPLEYSLRMKSIEHIEEFLYLAEDSVHPKLFKQSRTYLKSIARQLETSGIYIGTTLVVFDFINNCLDDSKFAALRQDTLVKYIARQQRENFLTEKNDYRRLKDRVFDGVPAKELFRQQFVWMKSFAKLLSDAGVPLITGSDTYGMVVVGYSLHKEFEFLQSAGLSPYQILRASTVNAARYLDTYASEGTIAEGKNANLVLLNKNPMENISNTRSIDGVILKGKWIGRLQLDNMLKEVEKAYE